MAEAKRFYKPEEKLRIALEGLSGTIQISELCRKYDIKPARFYHWKEKLLQSSQIFDDRGKKPNIDEKIRSKDEEIARLKDVIAEITQENLVIWIGILRKYMNSTSQERRWSRSSTQ